MEIRHNSNNREFWLERKRNDEYTGEEFITMAKIKEVITAVKLLFNVEDVKIYVSGGCIDVKPLDGKPMDFDTPIFNNFLVTAIKNNSLQIMIDNREYKSVKLNQTYTYEGKEYETCVLERVVIKY